MKPAQVRMARAALRWSLQDLAVAASVHRNTITNFENGRYAGTEEVLAAIQKALEKAGIEFIEGGVRERPGLHLSRPAVPQLARQIAADGDQSDPNVNED